MSEHMREQFEARFPVPDGVAWSDESQHYGWSKGTKQAIQAAMTYRALWTGWQQSRAAVVMELPPREATGVDAGGWPKDHSAHRVNKALAACALAIRAQGLKVAP